MGALKEPVSSYSIQETVFSTRCTQMVANLISLTATQFEVWGIGMALRESGLRVWWPFVFFGVGGVGSWGVEGLRDVRRGLRGLMILCRGHTSH